MKSTYSFLIHSTEELGKFVFDLIHFPTPDQRSLTKRQNVRFNSQCTVLDVTKPISQIHTVNENGEINPLSIICFWYIDHDELYGEFLYSGERVKGWLDGDLSNKENPGSLTLVIDEERTFDNPMFDNLGDDENIFQWQTARRLKKLKTKSISIYNNHGFYTITYSDNVAIVNQ